MPDPAIPIIPAATLVLFRDRADAPPELLIVERSRELRFAGGALVFPGGRVDGGDQVLAAGHDDPEDAAARIAAIRETLEEAGLAIGFDPAPDHAQVAALREALARGEDFGALLAAGGWALDLDVMAPWARWCPAPFEAQKRVFDTRFYIAHLPPDAPEPIVDATENVRLFWAGADEVLALGRRGEAQIIFPTLRNLERLALFARFEDAAAHCAGIPVQLIQPHLEDRADGAWLCIPEGLGYPVTGQPLSEVRRG